MLTDRPADIRGSSPGTTKPSIPSTNVPTARMTRRRVVTLFDACRVITPWRLGRDSLIVKGSNECVELSSATVSRATQLTGEAVLNMTNTGRHLPIGTARRQDVGRASRCGEDDRVQAATTRVGIPIMPLSWYERSRGVGAENLCQQAVFMDHAASAVTPLDSELVQAGDGVG